MREYTRIQVISNSPEFAKKEGGKCGHMIKDFQLLLCSMMFYDCPETYRQDHTENFLRASEDNCQFCFKNISLLSP